MKTTEIRKLEKALQMLKKAHELVEQVAGKNDRFKHSPNAVFRSSRISAAVSILETEIHQVKS